MLFLIALHLRDVRLITPQLVLPLSHVPLHTTAPIAQHLFWSKKYSSSASCVMRADTAELKSGICLAQ